METHGKDRGKNSERKDEKKLAASIQNIEVQEATQDQVGAAHNRVTLQKKSKDAMERKGNCGKPAPKSSGHCAVEDSKRVAWSGTLPSLLISCVGSNE